MASSTPVASALPVKGEVYDIASVERPPAWGHLHNSDTKKQSPWSRKIILSLDGGGVRGYSSLLVLEELMKKVKEEEKRVALCESSATYCWETDMVAKNRAIPGHEGLFRPCHYIDYFFGTSTGGLSAIMLGRLQMTPRVAQSQYGAVCKAVFGNPRRATLRGILAPRFKADNMEAALQYISQRVPEESGLTDGIFDIVGQTPKEKDVVRLKAKKIRLWNGNDAMARTVVVAHGGNLSKELHLFRSYDHPPPIQEPTKPGGSKPKHHPALQASDVPLWKVGRATSAAPSYFSAMKIGDDTFRDGAIGKANNPVRIAYQEVKQMHWQQEPCMIISIGTGTKAKKERSEASQSRARRTLPSIVDNVLENFQQLKSFQSEVLNSETIHEEFNSQLEGANKYLDSEKEDRILYFRFNVPDIGSIKLGEWEGMNGTQTTSKMDTHAKRYLESQSDALNACAKKLVEVRRRRQKTARWESFALDLKYRCPEQGDCGSLLFDARSELREHGIRVHGIHWQVPCVLRKDNRVLHEWACFWEQCGERHVCAFDSEDEFIAHLRKEHGISNAHVKSTEDFEEWLDRGRLPDMMMLSRNQTGIISKHGTMYQQ